QGPRMFHTQGRHVGVVAEKGELGSPRHPHGVARCKHDLHGGLEAAGPSRNRSDGSLGPVELPNDPTHFSTTGDRLTWSVQLLALRSATGCSDLYAVPNRAACTGFQRPLN